MADSSRQNTPESRRQRMPHLRGLDGLRAIAVVAVMLYHFDVPLPGGFLGVDLFFVLSGYLITSQVFVRWGQDGIDLWAFWTARIRRLFPAVLALLIGVSALMLIAGRDQMRSFGGDVLAAGTYTSNWWYIFHERSYFEAQGRPPVLQHLWSLAVEEQFYLFWPLVVAGLTWAFARRTLRRRALFVVSALGAAASAAWMGWGTAQANVPLGGDPSRFYFGTDSHAMGLLAGAALAAWRNGAGFAKRAPALQPASLRVTLLGGVALVALGGVFLRVGEFSEGLYRWGFTAFALLGVFLIVVATRPGPLERLLSGSILGWLGTRSYSLYLWHWPIASFTRPGQDVQFSEELTFVVRWVLTLAAAEARYRWVETPVRREGWATTWQRLSQLGRGPWNLASGLVGLAVVLGLGVGAVAARTPVPPDEQVVAPQVPDSVDDPLPSSTDQPRMGDDPNDRKAGDESRGSGSGPPSESAPSPEPTASPGTSASPNPEPTASAGPSAPSSTAPGSSRSEGTQEPGVEELPVPSDGTTLLRNTQDLDVWLAGDSVALASAEVIELAFGTVEVHAEVGLQAYDVLPDVETAARDGEIDSDVVVIHTGNNGVIDPGQLREALRALRDVPRVVLVVPAVDASWMEPNRRLFNELMDDPPTDNVRFADWYAASADRPEWFTQDQVHPEYIGEVHYTRLIQEAALRD